MEFKLFELILIIQYEFIRINLTEKLESREESPRNATFCSVDSDSLVG